MPASLSCLAVGSVEQISGANEQIPERGQTYLSGIGPKVMLGFHSAAVKLMQVKGGHSGRLDHANLRDERRGAGLGCVHHGEWLP